jgi:hypothetical protein
VPFHHCEANLRNISSSGSLSSPPPGEINSLILSEDLNVIGDISYGKKEKDGSLSSVEIIFSPNADIEFIKNLYFKKYGTINENIKSDEYIIQEDQQTNYYEFEVEGFLRKTYSWNKGDLQVVLFISESSIEVRYQSKIDFYKKNTVKEDIKKDIESNF